MKGRRKLSGATLIEGLVSTWIVGVCIFGAMGLWNFCANMTMESDEKAVGYNIIRINMERVKAQGFWSANNATYYYDQFGGNEQSVKGTSFYQVTITITNSAQQTQNGVTYPADEAIRTVVVKAYRVSDGSEIGSGGTLLTRGGL